VKVARRVREAVQGNGPVERPEPRLGPTSLLPVRGRAAGDAGQCEDRTQHPGPQNRRVSDAAWLAQLGAHGLLRPCFVPPPPIRILRDLTRARTIATEDRTREVQRLEKFLESTGTKLSDHVSDLMGMSSRTMVAAALNSGERDPQVLANLAKGRMRPRIPELVEALTRRFEEHRAFLCTMHLERIDSITGWVDQLTERIEAAMEPFRVAREFLTTIPGVSTLVADVIVAETGADMSTFESPGRLASWAGLSPGSNESAGRVKSTRIRPGNRYLKGRWAPRTCSSPATPGTATSGRTTSESSCAAAR
jgi:transposase